MPSFHLDLVQIHQRRQLVVGRPGIEPPCDQHRAEEIRLRFDADARQFVLPEFLVEAGVVRHQRGVADKFVDVGHDLFGRRCAAHHGGGDAGEFGDEARHVHAGIHEAGPGAGEAVFAAGVALDHDGGDFERAPALVGHEPVGFKVDDGVAAHGIPAARRILHGGRPRPVVLVCPRI